MKKMLSLAVIAAALFMTFGAMAQVQPVAAPGVAREQGETLFSLLVKGGPMMIPLGLCSIIGLAIAVERMVSLTHDRIVPSGFVEGLKRAMATDDDAGADQAVKYCEASASPVGRIFQAGLMSLPLGPNGVSKTIEDAGALEANKLKRSIRGLSVIASLSPLLGLVGTVYGLIEVFQVAAVGGMGKADLLAQGIYEALVTTATGLTIAIPFLLIYQYMNSKVSGLVDEIDEMGMVFMASCIHTRSASPKGSDPQ